MPALLRKRRSAFTIVEIILVIAIILLLIVAILPAFRSKSSRQRYELKPAKPRIEAPTPQPAATPVPVPAPADDVAPDPAGAVESPASK